MVPNDRRWSETQRPTLLLQAPTDVYVVSCNSKTPIKATNRLQLFQAISHVAAWNMFSDFVRQKDMNRPSGRMRDGLCGKAIIRRRNVRPPNPNMV